MDHVPEDTQMPSDASTVLGGLTSRRKFIKGASLVLPAVVTLHNGTALAATSIGCGGMGNIPQSYANVLTKTYAPPPDNLFRVSVEIFSTLKLTTQSTGKAWLPDPTDANKFYFRATGSSDNGKWRRQDGTEVVNDGINFDQAGDGELSALISKLPSLKITPKQCRYAIAHISTSDGTLVAVGLPINTPPPGGSIITSWTGACIASICGIKLPW